MGLILRTALAVHPDQRDAFERVARAWVERTRQEADTLGFHLFLDAAGEAIFLEHYRDAAAFEVHAAAVDPALRAELYRTCTFLGLDVYGPVTEEVRETLGRANAHFYPHLASR